MKNLAAPGAAAGFVMELDYRVPAPKQAAKVKNLQAGETSLAFLVHPTLSEQEIADTCRALEKVMECGAR